MNANRIKPIFVAGLVLLLAACGGGGSGSGPDNDPGPIGGIDRGGIAAQGPITGFGSVIVNGTTFDTSQAQIVYDGAVVAESRLRVGQIVTVVGTSDTSGNTADRIEFDDNVEGPIDQIDAVAGVIVVLGQTVIIDNSTIFDDDIPTGSLDGLNVGDVVEVSGFVNANGDVVASRIELDDDGGEFEITGTVSSADNVAMTFVINALVVDYSGAVLEDFDGAMPMAGDIVEAKGSQFGGNGELVATNVELKNDIDDDDDVDEDTEIEIEGFITRFVSDTDFDVAGIRVTTTTSTEYEAGTAADLALDVRVEVEGNFDANGTLVAREIDFEGDGDVRVHALVDSVDAAAGEVTMLTITVQIDSQTSMEDKSDLDLRIFTISDINVGDWLEVRGSESAPGTILASQLERDEADNESRIRGFATDVVDPSFRILGLDIDTDAGTSFDGTTSIDFFATAQGMLVQADGNLNGGRLLATEVEFEDDD
jgi:hypothetical protein